jgi:hypothetical protein
MNETLTDANFVLYAAKNYVNPHCTDVIEFNEDLNRIKYIKRLFRKFCRNGELKERLILNHLVILYNVFDPKALTRMLIFKLIDYLQCLLPFLTYLGFIGEKIDHVGHGNGTIIVSDHTMDIRIIDVLRKL